LFHTDRNNESNSRFLAPEGTRLTEHPFYSKEASEIVRINGSERVLGKENT